MPSLPVSAFTNGTSHGFGNTECFPGGIIANQFVKGPMLQHDRGIAKPVIQSVSPDLAMPQRVIAPRNEGNR